jgi:hypothetical protein
MDFQRGPPQICSAKRHEIWALGSRFYELKLLFFRPAA